MHLLFPLVPSETGHFSEEHVSPVSFGKLLADCARSNFLPVFRVGDLFLVTFMNIEPIPHGTTGTIEGKKTLIRLLREPNKMDKTLT